MGWKLLSAAYRGKPEPCEANARDFATSLYS